MHHRCGLSLGVQGDPITAAEATNFAHARLFAHAVQLRRFDNWEKHKGARLNPLQFHLPMVAGLTSRLPA